VRFTGQALVEGQIRYAPDTGEFFFDAPKMVEVTVGGIPESMRQRAEDLIATCAEAYLTITPVYRLEQTTSNSRWREMLLKSVKVRDGQLQVCDRRCRDGYVCISTTSRGRMTRPEAPPAGSRPKNSPRVVPTPR